MARNTRDVFFEKIYQKVKSGEDIVIVSSDLAGQTLDQFRIEFPHRYVSVGIAEQNMIAVAAGLAQCGKKVFAYGSSPFVWSRTYDQLRNLMGCMDVPITLISIGVGINFSSFGPTHFNVEDLAVLRGIANLKINAVNNATMTQAALDYSLALSHPNFLRMEHSLSDPFYEDVILDYEKGLISRREGHDLLIVSTASPVITCAEVVNRLRNKKIDAGLMEIISLPMDEIGLCAALRKATQIVTVEEHNISGGLGAAISECMAKNDIVKPIKHIGLDFTNGYYYSFGTTAEVRSYLGLDSDSIEQTICNWLK
ncbi:transketolase C-terminal domain-containing protein [Oscillibacter sp.]|uniref:transketolase family protein n=1 Tax=Oscillibacter sp. TaxID=1945593 RepID=UPI0028A7FC19|nr:transketolase C-terminal domain-containing protein [Oscillibacter sp.]